MINRLLLGSLCLLAGSPARAWQPAPDNDYIESYGGALHLYPFLGYQSVGMELRQDGAPPLRLQASEDRKLGAGFNWRDYGFAYGYKVEIGGWQQDDNVYGPSHGNNFFFHSYTRKYAADFYLSKNQGFYLADPDSVGTAKPPNGYPLYPDMKTFLAAVQVLQVFNHEKFSIKAAFDQTERQKKGAGSFLMLYSMVYSEMSNPAAVIPADIQDRYSEFRGLKAFKTWSLGAGPGYAHTFVFLKRAFFTPMICLNLGLQQQALDLDAGWNRTLALALRAAVRGSLGYNGKRFFAGTSAIMEDFKTARSKGDIDLLTVDAQVFAGWRF